MRIWYRNSELDETAFAVRTDLRYRGEAIIYKHYIFATTGHQAIRKKLPVVPITCGGLIRRASASTGDLRLSASILYNNTAGL
jgi:hypothetical protein